MLQAVTFAAAIGAIWKALDFLKYIRAKDVNAAVTQAVAWLLGVGAMFLFAQAEIADGWDLGVGKPLSALDGASLVILGVMVASGGSVAYDFKRAFDGTDSAATPSLLNESSPGD